MSEALLPHVVRNIVIDDSMNTFLSRLNGYSIEPNSEPTLQLITTDELCAVPAEAKEQLLTDMMAIAEDLEDRPATSADVIRARIFFRKRVGHVSLSLAVRSNIGDERRSVTDCLRYHGIDTSGHPYNRFKFQTNVARYDGGKSDLPIDEVYETLNTAFPKRVKLESPSY